jgi:hypothetical protein
MTTIIGDALMIVLGNKDVLVVVSAFTISLSLLYAILMAWKYKH